MDEVFQFKFHRWTFSLNKSKVTFIWIFLKDLKKNWYSNKPGCNLVKRGRLKAGWGVFWEKLQYIESLKCA